MTEEKKFKPSREEFFDPNNEDGTMRCCCGFELILESGDTWRCGGGNHRYRVQDGTALLDKFGNLMMQQPEDSN